VAESEKLFGGISEEQLNWKLTEDSWSIGECINHLVITHRLYYPGMNKAVLSKNNDGSGSFPFYHTFGAKMILKYVDPKEKRKSKTFKIFKPEQKYITNSRYA